MAAGSRALPFVAAFLISAALGAAFPLVTSIGRPAASGPASRGSLASSTADLPHFKPVPDFRLTDTSGRQVSQADLRGKVWIANFFFTSCKGPCPRMVEQLSRIYRLNRSRPDFAAVSITIDPQTDTSAKLAEFAAKLGVDTQVWHFLTGPIDKIISLSNDGFYLAADDQRGHSPVFVLIDRSGTVRGYYQSADPEKMVRLGNDLDLLMSAGS